MSEGRVTGAVRLGGVVGQPIAHSLSPVIHNAWLAEAGMDGLYAAFAPEDAAALEILIQAGRAGMLRGLNITSPYKEQAFAAADTTSDTVRASGSANLLTFRDGRVHADSTDGLGLLNALKEQSPGLALEGADVVMLGAGGAARAAVLALVGAGARVTLINRTVSRAQSLIADLALPEGGVATAAETEGQGTAALEAADLIVNALSVRPEIDMARLRPDATAMDMTYKPLMTPFLTAAKARGLTPVDGLAMLIGQAGPSYEAIFDAPPPPMGIRSVVLRALGEAA